MAQHPEPPPLGWGPPKREAPAPAPAPAAQPPARPIVTILIVALNCGVMAAMAASGISPTDPDVASLVRWGSNYGPYTLSGEPWRLLTAAFLHGGLLHLGMNMYVLWGAGRTVERFYGRLAYVEVYVFAALTGSIASVLANPNVHSVGASGAIFGVVGAFGAFLLVNRSRIRSEVRGKLLKSLGFFLAINLAIGFLIPMIDQAAHVGGLVGGAVGGIAVAPRLQPGGPSIAAWRYALLPVACALLFLAGAALGA